MKVAIYSDSANSKLTAMKNLFIAILLAISECSYSQVFVQGTVIDSKTKTQLPFCNVAIKGTSRGCITNEEGAYQISVNAAKDTLVFSYVGYRMQIIPTTLLLQNANVFMESKSTGLKEITIHSDDDYLYDVIEHCRKNIQASHQQVVKAYFQLETEIQEQTVEMLECYYNSYVKGSSVEKLLLKNGRIGLAESQDNGFFTSRNTSQVICDLSLTDQNGYLPSLILQYNKSKLKKFFKITPMYDDNNTYHIEFTPRKNTNSFFSGEVWIDKETFFILKINLSCGNTDVHPFLPLFENGTVKNVSIYITETYTINGKMSLLNHINFSYHLNYNNGHPASRLYNGSNSDYEVKTNGVMFFYDYEKPFLLPYFKYDVDETDYRKITSMPYNEFFWKSNAGLLYTEKQKQSLEFFNNHGVLVNYSNKKSKLKGNWNVFEDNNIIWSDTNRIVLKANHLDSLLRKDSLVQKNHQFFLSDLYHLQAQLFLDINPSEDSIQHFSATVFDVFDSYYNLPVELYTDCFLNIYFDICEIERRQMERTLCSHLWNSQQIDSIYQQTTLSVERKTTNYFKEVQLGKNTKELNKWNTYVLQNLNIDNIRMLGLNYK